MKAEPGVVPADVVEMTPQERQREAELSRDLLDNEPMRQAILGHVVASAAVYVAPACDVGAEGCPTVVAAFEAEVLDIGATTLTHPEPVEAEQHCERGVHR